MEPATEPDARRRYLHAGLLVLVFAVAIAYRVWVLVDFGDSDFGGVMIRGAPFSDARGWDVMASDFSQGTLHSGAWVGWSARRPFWWMFLGSVYALTAPSVLVGQLVNVLLSALAVVFAFDAARRLAGLPIALVMAGAICFQETDISYALTTMSEPLGSFLTVLGAWVCVLGCERISARPWRWPDGFVLAGGGLCLALSNLARPLNLPALAAMPLVIFVIARARSSKALSTAVFLGAFFVMGVVLALGPWLVRQHSVHGFVALSDNSAVAMYAATHPEYGSWTAEVTGLASGMTVGEQYQFFAEGTKENLRNHLGFYAGNVWKNLLIGVRQISVPLWALLAVLALSLADIVMRTQPGARLGRSLIAHAALAAGCFYLPPDGVTLLWVGASVFALVRGHRLAVVSVVLLSSILLMGLACLVMQRFTYSLNWMAVLLTGWLLWGLARRFSDSGEETGVWAEPAPVGLGFVARWGRIASAGAMLLLLVGAGKATALTLSGSGWSQTFLTEEHARPWVATALQGDVGAVYEAYWPYMQVASARPRSGYDRVFGPGEGFSAYAPPFTPRAYTNTMFDLDPRPSTGVYYSHMPGDVRERLPEAVSLAGTPGTSEWLWIGVLAKPERKISFEVMALVLPGNPPLLVQPRLEAAVRHVADLQGKTLIAADKRVLGRVAIGDVYTVIPDRTRLNGTTMQPILFVGDKVVSQSAVISAYPFEPTFGAGRAVVNPAEPSIVGRDFVFTSPGEYYLMFGDGQVAKACVLSHQESWSRSVLRIFDFCVANTVRTNSRISEWDDRAGLRETWLRQRGPLPLTSPDAGKLFTDLVKGTLGLPVRFVSLPGVTRENGKFERQSLFLPEIYLPDKGGYVLFDVLNGWYVPWLDAAACARAISDLKRQSIEVNVASLSAAGLAPEACTPEPRRLKTPVSLDDVSEGRLENLLTDRTGREWSTFGHIYGGGVAYYGAARGKGLGTGFIAESYVFGSLHDDATFDEEVTRWIGTWYEDVTVVRLEELEERLVQGHAPSLQEANWDQARRPQ